MNSKQVQEVRRNLTRLIKLLYGFFVGGLAHQRIKSRRDMVPERGGGQEDVPEKELVALNLGFDAEGFSTSGSFVKRVAREIKQNNARGAGGIDRTAIVLEWYSRHHAKIHAPKAERELLRSFFTKGVAFNKSLRLPLLATKDGVLDVAAASVLDKDVASARLKFFENLPSRFRSALEAPALTLLQNARIQSHGRFKIFFSCNNEMEIISEFLRHHRRLGEVIFFAVDNESTDGTRDYLLEQEDVHVFETNQRFDECGFGSSWINQLIERYSSESEYVARLDVDEFLIFDENVDIPGMWDGLPVEDVQCGPLIDVFPERIGDIWDCSFSECLHKITKFKRPYVDHLWFLAPYVMFRGGLREVLLAGTRTNLTKSAIIRGGGRVKFVNANHFTSPGSVAFCNYGLLHYKITPKMYEKFQHQLERGQHFNGGGRYRKFWALQEDTTPEPGDLADGDINDDGEISGMLRELRETVFQRWPDLARFSGDKD